MSERPEKYPVLPLLLATLGLIFVLGVGFRLPIWIVSIACLGTCLWMLDATYPGGAGAALARLREWFKPVLPPRWVRLTLEIAVLLMTVGYSAWIWRPGFYIDEEERCLTLARWTRQVPAVSLEARVGLESEAAWLMLKASELRGRGLWLGFRMGPFTADEVKMCDIDIGYQMGVLESMEKHEKQLIRYTRSPLPYR